MRSIPVCFIVPWLSRRRWAWRREIGLGQPYQLIAELLPQHSGADFFNFALTKLTELERPERNADQPSDAEPEMAEHIADFAVLAFTNAEREPHVRALHAIKRGFDRAIMNVIDGHAAL